VPNAVPSIDGVDTRKTAPSLAGQSASSAGATADVRSTRLVETGPSYIARLSGTGSAVDTVAVDVASTRLVVTGPSYSPRLDFASTPNTTVLGALDVIAGATQFPVSAGRTIYLGLLEDTTVSEVEIPMPAGQALELVVESDAAPGVSESFAYEVMKNGVASGLAVSVTDTATGAYITGTLAFVRRDRFALRLVTSAGAASAKHKFSVRYLVAGG
jgi:hypothetical protein